jgi:uncharacterized LabA/DUF88 family protein
MQKIAILIDGGFFLKRLKNVFPSRPVEIKGISFDIGKPDDVQKIIASLVQWHLDKANIIAGAHNSKSLLYRVFYYDATPFKKRIHLPISKNTIDFGKTPESVFREKLFESLKMTPNVALRLGEVRDGKGWQLKKEKQEAILTSLKSGNSISIKDLSDEDFYFDLRQKAVDMRIGVDITSLTLKKQVDQIILISGDGDFAPAAKLARMEGITFILDLLGQSAKIEFLEHVDEITSSFDFFGVIMNSRQKVEV